MKVNELVTHLLSVDPQAEIQVCVDLNKAIFKTITKIDTFGDFPSDKDITVYLWTDDGEDD